MQRKPIRTGLVRMIWEGNKAIILRQQIIDGPEALIDKRLNLSLSFEQIEELVGHMNDAKKRLAESQARLDATNAGNQVG